MSDFRISTLSNSSVIGTYHERESIFLTPEYQRGSDIWSLEKRQSLIDSLLNGFDIPKLYFHEFYPSKVTDGKKIKYAIVDGKQRLQAIWGFIDNVFTLAPQFDYFRDPSVKIAGLTYKEIGEKYSHIRDVFNGVPLPIVTIVTSDTELIEDMFSRLNEAYPLNAAEKRNAYGGPIPALIRKGVRHPFFKTRLPFTNSRYRHFDLICKFLYLAEEGTARDTKRKFLDEFVRESRDKKLALALMKKVEPVLSAMGKIFRKKDELLRSPGMVTVYFLLFYRAISDSTLRLLTRKKFEIFDAARKANRVTAEEDERLADYNLLEFDRFTQSPNDKFATEFRLQTLSAHVFENSE